MVRELLARGAQLELKDKKGHTALWWAGDAGRLGVVRKLQARGAVAVGSIYWEAAVEKRD